MKCPVCKTKLQSNFQQCTTCGFDDLEQIFLNQSEAELWMKEVVLPFRETYLNRISSNFEIDNGVLHCYKGSNPVIRIPTNVVSIDDSAFENNKNIESIEFPDGLQRIGLSAFEGCLNLKQIHIPDSVQVISESAFRNCRNLKEAILPKSITEILDRSFEGCKELTRIKLPSNVTHIGSRAFCYCSSLNDVSLSENLHMISQYAFMGCNLQIVRFPSCLEHVMKGAFLFNPIDELIIPDSNNLSPEFHCHSTLKQVFGHDDMHFVWLL